MSKTENLSEDEMVSHLKRTLLPTILVEGNDELSVYNRYLQDKINIEDVDILACDGRAKLLNVFKRRAEFKTAKVVFVADKDMWFFKGVPEEYDNKVIFTDGYSLENDLYIEAFFNRLLDANEARNFNDLIKELSVWFAFEVNRYQELDYVWCDFHVNQICPEKFLSESFKESISFVEPPTYIVKSVYSEYTRALRGKNLFQALIRFLSHKNRESKYSRANLIEMGAKFPNPRLEELVKKIVGKFQEYG
jgi:hypothetical protein